MFSVQCPNIFGSLPVVHSLDTGYWTLDTEYQIDPFMDSGPHSVHIMLSFALFPRTNSSQLDVDVAV
jgi:hypothetical protein